MAQRENQTSTNKRKEMKTFKQHIKEGGYKGDAQGVGTQGMENDRTCAKTCSKHAHTATSHIPENPSIPSLREYLCVFTQGFSQSTHLF